MIDRRHLPSSETRIGVSPRDVFSRKGSSSAACSTRSIETSSACDRRQIVASVGLVALNLTDDRFGDARLFRKFGQRKIIGFAKALHGLAKLTRQSERPRFDS